MAKHSIRIIGGKWRSRQITVPDVATLRPTPNRVRETVFNWLMAYLPNAICLDAFAGSGALGFEALSRGAQSVTLIEKNKIAITQLQQTKQMLAAQHCDIIQADALSYQFPGSTKFDLVLLDPPFQQNLLLPFCQKLQAEDLLTSNAIIYIETATDTELALPETWQRLKHKQTGEVAYSLWTVSQSQISD